MGGRKEAKMEGKQDICIVGGHSGVSVYENSLRRKRIDRNL